MSVIYDWDKLFHNWSIQILGNSWHIQPRWTFMKSFHIVCLNIEKRSWFKGQPSRHLCMLEVGFPNTSEYDFLYELSEDEKSSLAKYFESRCPSIKWGKKEDRLRELGVLND